MNARLITLLGLLIIIGGCAVSSLNRVDTDNETRARLLASAERGDADAQYRLGLAYCCGAGFYSTETAIKWWCRAAIQGHEEAQRKLSEHASEAIPENCRKSLT